ncbi:hypothetical protein OIV83_005621, partial [Microbotryomycetes sp. JL201]
QLASAAPSKRAPTSSRRGGCQTRFGPESAADAASPSNPQTATTACPVYANQTVEIPVYTYIPYYDTKTLANNYFTTTQLMKGINDLNKHYGQYKPRIKFTLKTPKYKRITDDDIWDELHYLEPADEEDIDYLNEMVTIPARGQLSTRGSTQMRQLWLYLLPGIGTQGTLGYSFVPQSKTPFLHDGVFLDASRWLEDQATVAHEVGHWLRLLHTFEGGCKGTDFVSDTPPWQDTSNAESISCKGSPGYSYNDIVNPCKGSKSDAIKNIKNIMSYSDDHCQIEFTFGQRKRFWDAATNYRLFKPVCGPVK